MDGATQQIRKWSTAEKPARQGLDYWVGVICEGFLEMDASSPIRSNFHGALESARLGPVGVNRVVSSAQDVFRTQRGIARSTENFYYLLCKTDTAWSAAQGGRSASLRPGDSVLVDSRRSYEFHFPVSADTVSLELPTTWVETWLPEPARMTAQRIDGQSGWGHALSAFVRQWTPEMAIAPPLPHALLCDQLGSLLSLAITPPPPASSKADTGQLDLILQAIRERHAEPGLTAAHLAQQLNISPRSLHRHLARASTTLGQQLMSARLTIARRMLLQPSFDHLTVAEIGRRSGLSDASHFVRTFRKLWGETPGALRLKR